jgi:chromosome segregation ATPase
MAFVEWLQLGVKALERGQALPESSKLGGDITPWIEAIRNLEDRRRESEEIQINLESDMRAREAYVGRLTQQLQASMEEMKAAQANSHQLQQELTSCKEMLAKVAEVVSEVGSYDSQLKSIASEVLSKGSQLDKLAHSFREVSITLRAIAKNSANS